jgi:endoglucanase
MKLIKRALSLLLVMAIAFGAVSAAQLSLSTQATMPETVRTNITSLEYVFNAYNVTAPVEVTFVVTGRDGWPMANSNIFIMEDGPVVFELPTLNFIGLGNPGFVEVIEDSEIVLEFESVLVNGEHLLYPNPDLEFDLTLQLGDGESNALPNQWNGSLAEGDILAMCEDGITYLEFQDIWYFFIPGEGGTIDPIVTERVEIHSLTYNFDVEGVETATNIVFEITDSEWRDFNVSTRVMSNAPLSINFADSEFSGTSALVNPGFVRIVEDSPIVLDLISIVVNDDYILYANTDLGLILSLEIGVALSNGLPNMWNTALQTGDKLAISEDRQRFLEFEKDEGWFFAVPSTRDPEDTIMQTSRSIDYAQAMGVGWNLGNTLDGFLADGNYNPVGTVGWETAWGNPVTTKEFIQSIADRGFEHIRIPFSIISRHTDHGEDTPDDEIRFEINADWLARYVEIVEWSLEAGLYVMINIHHDSWFWLGRNHGSNPLGAAWDGDVESVHFRKFTDYWKQIAQAFADMPDEVMFETINEPEFNAPQSHDQTNPENQRRNDVINKAAFDIIRSIEGNEDRMVIIPTYMTNHARRNSRPTRDFIADLEDENIIATVHYYSEWVWSQHLGRMMFDEPLFTQFGGTDAGAMRTARTSADEFFGILDEFFLSEGIGVSVGEWGLLGYDSDTDSGGANALQRGEELKYYEYIQHLTRETEGVSLSFWDNGSGIDRRCPDFSWRVPEVGEMLLSRERSAYSTGLDTLYFNRIVSTDVRIELTLNGNTLESIEGIAQADYTINNAGDAVYLSRGYVNRMINAKAADSATGIMATLVFKFDGGVDWTMYLIRTTAAESYRAAGTRSGGITIPIDFNGNHIHRISAFRGEAPEVLSGIVFDTWMNSDPNHIYFTNPQGTRVGGDHISWWPYLQYGQTYAIDYADERLFIRSGFFTNSVQNGVNVVVIEFLNGTRLDITLTVEGANVTAAGKPVPNGGDDILYGDINGNGVVEITDVLEILKLLAGLDNLITQNEDALAAARITVEAPAMPTINCALEILKFLAGLDSKLDVLNIKVMAD